MAKYYDENGNEVTDVVSKTDSDAAVEAAKAAAIDAYKTEHPEPVAPAAEEVKPSELQVLQDQITSLTGSLTKEKQDAAIRTYTGGDPDKEATLRAEFDRMTGYEDAGARAAAAAKVAFGEVKVVNPTDFSGAGSGRTPDGANAAPLSRPVDLEIQKKLGISAEDVAKYGAKIEGQSPAA